MDLETGLEVKGEVGDIKEFRSETIFYFTGDEQYCKIDTNKRLDITMNYKNTRTPLNFGG